MVVELGRNVAVNQATRKQAISVSGVSVHGTTLNHGNS